jgi:hypothetical protein
VTEIVSGFPAPLVSVTAQVPTALPVSVKDAPGEPASVAIEPVPQVVVAVAGASAVGIESVSIAPTVSARPPSLIATGAAVTGSAAGVGTTIASVVVKPAAFLSVSEHVPARAAVRTIVAPGEPVTVAIEPVPHVVVAVAGASALATVNVSGVPMATVTAPPTIAAGAAVTANAVALLEITIGIVVVLPAASVSVTEHVPAPIALRVIELPGEPLRVATEFGHVVVAVTGASAAATESVSTLAVVSARPPAALRATGAAVTLSARLGAGVAGGCDAAVA